MEKRKEKSQNKMTLDYYNQNAKRFVETTRDVDFTKMQNEFLKYLQPKAHILDFGCGAGRDSKVFIEQGYQVTAIDGSEALCRLASEYLGVPVKQMLFQELEEKDCYNGIWACSSILHLEKKELHTVIQKLVDALKKDGYFYTSFKYGEFEGMRNDRYFTDMTETRFATFIRDIPELEIVEYFITGDVRQGRENEQWLNVILRKKTI